MSDASFAAIDAGLADVLSLSEENARLRAMLAAAQAQAAPVTVKVTSPVEVDSAKLAKELAAARAAQQQAERELQVLRGAHPSVIADAVEDQSSEVGLLRSSLATLASELETEKVRAAEAEALREEEENKVHTLRVKMEESRQALMRIQGESKRRVSNDMYAPVARRASALDTIPRRRSSLGLASHGGIPVATPVPVSGTGLGLAVESPSISALSTSPSGKPSPLHRFATRRGSASLAPETREEDDRAAKLRDLRLGVTTTKVSSRRGSLANGLPDFFGLADFDFDADRKLNSPYRFGRHGSISEEGHDPIERPPSAPLRLGGRNNSVAVFENWSRRSSTSSCSSYTFGSLASGSMMGAYSSQSSADGDERLLMQLEGLRIQLAESEEGRRASELCVKALKDFISTRPGGSDISLPPLPTDSSSASFEPPRRSSSGSRWSIPRLSLGGGPRSSSPAPSTSPNLTTYTRRTSTTSNSSISTSMPPLATPHAPIFGGFSFSALVSRSSTADDGDTSPTMGGPSSQSGFFQNSFPVDPSPQMQDDSANFSPTTRGSGSSTAPSLCSASTTSSRSSSPINDDEDDEDEQHDEPEIVFASAENFSCAPTKGYLKESVRMPVLPSGLGLGF